jgi:hypothetical protein
MAALTKFFFRAPYALPSTGEIWRWWEQRRPVYNLVVMVAGITSLATVYLTESMIPGGNPSIPWVGIVVYGILANLAYTLGPIADSFVTRTWGREYSVIGPALFRYGFAFAVGLTLLPVAMMAIRVAVGFLLRVF